MGGSDRKPAELKRLAPGLIAVALLGAQLAPLRAAQNAAAGVPRFTVDQKFVQR